MNGTHACTSQAWKGGRGTKKTWPVIRPFGLHEKYPATGQGPRYHARKARNQQADSIHRINGDLIACTLPAHQLTLCAKISLAQIFGLRTHKAFPGTVVDPRNKLLKRGEHSCRGCFISAVQRMNPESIKNHGTQVNPQLQAYLTGDIRRKKWIKGLPAARQSQAAHLLHGPGL